MLFESENEVVSETKPKSVIREFKILIFAGFAKNNISPRLLGVGRQTGYLGLRTHRDLFKKHIPESNFLVFSVCSRPVR